MIRSGYILTVVLALLYSCGSSSNEDNSFEESEEIRLDDKTEAHYDDNYKYEQRSGTVGDRQYNYDIDGYDEDGNYVYGNVDMDNGYGSGYIYTEDGDEVYIDLEWYDYGQMEGYDENGVYYELEAQ